MKTRADELRPLVKRYRELILSNGMTEYLDTYVNYVVELHDIEANSGGIQL